MAHAPHSIRALTLTALAAATLLGGCEGINDSIDSVSATAPREVRLTADSWTLTVGMFGENGDVKILYRAAVLAKAAGYSHFQVVDYSGGSSTTVQFRGVNDAQAPLHCVANDAYRAHCATWNSDRILASRGKMLGKNEPMIQYDIEAARQLDKGRPQH
ncbi:MAG: hypothetical protein V4574_04625 [Pseudomonadota bacterium]